MENPQNQLSIKPEAVSKQDLKHQHGGKNFQPRALFNNNMAPFQTRLAQAPYSPENKLEIMQQLFASHQKKSKEINTKVDNIYDELNGNFEGNSIHVKKLET